MRTVGRRSPLYGILPFVLSVSVSIASAEALRVEVVEASAVLEQPRTDRTVVSIRLSDSSKRAFAEFSKSQVGKPVDLRIDGRTVFQAVIREPLMGGRFDISLYDSKTARQVAEQLTSKTAVIEFHDLPQ